MKYVLKAVLIVFVFAVVSWHFCVTESFLEKIANAYLHNYGIKIDIDGLQRGFLFSFSVASLRLDFNDVQNNSPVINFLPPQNILFQNSRFVCNPLKMEVSLKGYLWEAAFVGQASLMRGVTVSITDLQIAHVLPRQYPIEGMLDFKWHYPRSTFSLQNIVFSKQVFPIECLHLISEGSGVLVARGDKLVIESVAFEGKGIFVAMHGNITKKRIKGYIDLVIENTFAKVSLLEKYKVKDGKYKIPIDIQL